MNRRTRRRFTRWSLKHAGVHSDGEPLFESGHLAHVSGWRMVTPDGRPAQTSGGAMVLHIYKRPEERIAGCVEVWRALRAAGVPVAEVIAGPAPFGRGLATLESHLPGSMPVDGPGLAAAHAAAFNELMRRAPRPEALAATLQPTPSWLAFDHTGPRLWPQRDDKGPDLNRARLPGFLLRGAEIARDRLARDRSPRVVGHGDPERQNLAVSDGTLYVLDLASIAVRSAAMFVGAAMGMYTCDGRSLTAPSLEESREYLEVCQDERRQAGTALLTPDEIQIAWAMSVWIRAYNGAKALTLGDRDEFVHLTRDLARRLTHAGW